MTVEQEIFGTELIMAKAKALEILADFADYYLNINKRRTEFRQHIIQANSQGEIERTMRAVRNLM